MSSIITYSCRDIEKLTPFAFNRDGVSAALGLVALKTEKRVQAPIFSGAGKVKSAEKKEKRVLALSAAKMYSQVPAPVAQSAPQTRLQVPAPVAQSVPKMREIVFEVFRGGLPSRIGICFESLKPEFDAVFIPGNQGEAIKVPQLPPHVTSPFPEEYTESVWARKMVKAEFTPKWEDGADCTFPAREGLGIYFVNKMVGWGLFTTVRIPQHTDLLLYAGEWYSAEDIRSQGLPPSDYFYGHEGSSGIDARRSRGLAAFCLHAPSEIPKTYRGKELSLEERKKYVTANVEFSERIFTCVDKKRRKLVVVRSLVDIMPNTSLMVDYGAAFWRFRGIEPMLFDRETGLPAVE